MGQALIRVSHKIKGSIILMILPLFEEINKYELSCQREQSKVHFEYAERSR